MKEGMIGGGRVGTQRGWNSRDGFAVVMEGSPQFMADLSGRREAVLY
jgi:hypothetical protein